MEERRLAECWLSLRVHLLASAPPLTAKEKRRSPRDPRRARVPVFLSCSWCSERPNELPEYLSLTRPWQPKGTQTRGVSAKFALKFWKPNSSANLLDDPQIVAILM